MTINIFSILPVSISIWIHKYLPSNYLTVKWNPDFLKPGFLAPPSAHNSNHKPFLLESFHCNFTPTKYTCMYLQLPNTCTSSSCYSLASQTNFCFPRRF